MRVMLGSRLVNAFFLLSECGMVVSNVGRYYSKVVFFIIIAAHLEILLFM